MEPVAAQRMWNQSVKKNKLQYTEIYGDGDSKSFNTVKNTYADIEVKNQNVQDMCRNESDVDYKI